MLTQLRKRLLKLIAVRLRQSSEWLESLLPENEGKSILSDEAPSAIAGSRRQGPPDHWVALVKEHAQELLRPAIPEDIHGESLPDVMGTERKEVSARTEVADSDVDTLEEMGCKTVRNPQTLPDDLRRKKAVEAMWNTPMNEERECKKPPPVVSSDPPALKETPKKKKSLAHCFVGKHVVPPESEATSVPAGLDKQCAEKPSGSHVEPAMPLSPVEFRAAFRKAERFSEKPETVSFGASTETSGTCSELRGHKLQKGRNVNLETQKTRRQSNQATRNAWAKRPVKSGMECKIDIQREGAGSSQELQSTQTVLTDGQPNKASVLPLTTGLSDEGERTFVERDYWPLLPDEIRSAASFQEPSSNWPVLPMERLENELAGESLRVVDRRSKLDREQGGRAWNALPF